MQRAYYRRLDLKLTATVLFIAAPLALGGCGLVQQAKMGKAKERLVALRADCRARYPDSHAQMADYSATVGDMANLGAPIPPIAALVAIVVEFFIALAVAFGAWTRPLALLLALYTLGTALIAHHFWTMDGDVRSENAINFYKNISIIGGFLLLYVTGGGRYSVDARLGSADPLLR